MRLTFFAITSLFLLPAGCAVPVPAKDDTASDALLARVAALETEVELLQGLELAIPVGTILPFTGLLAPPGFLHCDGSLVSKTDYPALYVVLNSNFDDGDESTDEFRLPDMRGRTAIGAGEGLGLSSRQTGQAVGAEAYVLSVDEMPPHAHLQDPHGHAVIDSGHYHTRPTAAGGGGTIEGIFTVDSGGGLGEGGPLTSLGYTGVSVGSTIATSQNSGGGGAHETMQPSLVLQFVIKF